MNPSRLPLYPLGASLLLLTLSGTPSLAQTIEAGPGRLTPAQQQKVFPEWRRLTLQSAQGRIAILQKHQQCVTAASSYTALKACQVQERQALMSQRQQQREAMRQLFERNGITLPSKQNDKGQGRRRQLQQNGEPML